MKIVLEVQQPIAVIASQPRPLPSGWRGDLVALDETASLTSPLRASSQ